MSKTFSQHTVNGETYLVCDKDARTASLNQKGYLASTDNINDIQFTKNGQWLLPSNEMNPPPTNWPSDEQGRLISFGGTDSNQAIRIQMVVDRLNRVFVRYIRTSDFAAWRQINMLIGNAEPSVSYTDVDNYPLNSIVFVGSDIHESISHFPDEYHVGGVVFTYGTSSWISNKYENAVQRIVFNNQKTSAWRMYRSNAWGEWTFDGVIEVVLRGVKESTGEPGTFVTPAYGFRYLMQLFNRWNEHYRGVLEFEAGEFSLSKTIDYIDDGTLDYHGLFLPPYCTLRGAGKDKTKFVFNYSGADETFMFYVSGLNVPYESVLEGFTMSVKNLRYTIHSDGGMDHMPDVTVPDQGSLLRDTRITVRDVRLINEGFDDGKQGTDPATGNAYICPACWGSGSWNNTIQEFYNCEFIANKYQAWFNHNRPALTEPSKFIFDHCIFVNGSTYNPNIGSNYTSLNMISWGSTAKDSVILTDSFVNRFVALSIRTDMGNASAVCNYELYADTPVPVFEYKTNSSHLADNYITANCKPEMAGGSITAYTPVSKAFIFDNVHTYNSAENYVGIAINSASAGEKVNVQYSGLVYLELLKTGGFAAGTNIGYNGSTWVEDNTHPIVRALSTLVGEILG